MLSHLFQVDISTTAAALALLRQNLRNSPASRPVHLRLDDKFPPDAHLSPPHIDAFLSCIDSAKQDL